MAHVHLGGSVLVGDIWGIGGSVGYAYASDLQRFDEPVVLSIDDDPVPAVIRHDRTSDLHSLFIEPMTYLQLGRYQLYAGVRVGYVVSASYLQKQEVLEPPGVTINGEAVIVEAQGEYPELRPITAAITVGMRTSGERVGPIRIEPGVNALFGLTTLSETEPTRQLAVGLDLRFRWDPAQARTFRVDTVVTTDTVFVETNDATRDDELATVSIDSNVIDIDNLRVTTIFINRQLTRYISVPPSTLLTEARASFIDDRGQAVTSWQIAFQKSMHSATFDAPLPCAVRPGRLVPSSRLDAVRILSQRFPDECHALLDTMTQPPSRTLSTGIAWKEEAWQPCTVRFELTAAGDVDVRSWKLLLFNSAGEVADSITGSGGPPEQVDYTFTSEAMFGLRNGAADRYEFTVVDVDGGRTTPVTGTLTFHAADPESATRMEWKLLMPWQQPSANDDVVPWTDEELRELQQLRPSAAFWQRCTFVKR